MSIIASAPVPAANRLIDADTAPNLTAIRRTDTNAGRFPTNQQYTGHAAVVHLPSAEDVALVERAAAVNPTGVHQLADAIRTGCPPWCSKDHRGHISEVDGFSIGLVHERIVSELTALDPTTFDDPATATVYVESTTEAGESAVAELITAPRVVLTVAEGPEGDYAGGENTGGWSGTPEQARALAAALLAAADLVDGGAR
ncbi:hypothetical protein GCE86_19710 [Micromonospora terminaliae]|uniref:Uncharacterized protein n=1 Tax=Micromonospora terminaliae TaxID=1914461 RepID=A0AAJ3DJH4_9ACTN|nr:hypothetical protein [Micromonospora terminaliae]NES28939.1 hypothetical protein [Micromonospora terminaliae]QGL49040.1 hypothetical protein GCE86_19710 [Micromonospora terminaliae]